MIRHVRIRVKREHFFQGGQIFQGTVFFPEKCKISKNDPVSHCYSAVIVQIRPSIFLHFQSFKDLI